MWRGFKPERRSCAACGKDFVARAAHARFCSRACRGRARAAPAERGYGRAHRELRARWGSAVAGGGVACARCGRLIRPDEPWDLDHDDYDRTRYLGPAHARCNRATAGRRALLTSRNW